ncbi:MAG: hypothetical protein HY707_06950 [Ignavibacteriae bacterium]|nr:hypothetical protein [Ignavibacteriota bacterium]
MLQLEVSIGQETENFAAKGVTELGGSISYQSVTPVYNGVTSDAITLFTISPFIGYFVTDGFELGVNPLGVTLASYGGGSTTQLMVLLAPSCNFITKGRAFPFIEGLIGYTSIGNGSERDGLSWGGRAGVKHAITNHGLLNLSVQYLLITTNPSGASNRYGSNNLSIAAGLTVWLQ